MSKFNVGDKVVSDYPTFMGDPLPKLKGVVGVVNNIFVGDHSMVGVDYNGLGYVVDKSSLRRVGDETFDTTEVEDALGRLLSEGASLVASVSEYAKNSALDFVKDEVPDAVDTVAETVKRFLRGL